jgi:hypothetical protein
VDQQKCPSGRPLRSAYEDLLDRALTTNQWDDANDIFRAHADAARSRCGLAADAAARLSAWMSAAGTRTQSLLSMTPHHDLAEVGYEVDHLHEHLYTDRMVPGVEPIPVEQYRGTGSTWKY